MPSSPAYFRGGEPRKDCCGLVDTELSHVAKGSTLASLRTNLERYLTDEKAGTIQARRYYGFHGDQRSSATRPIESPRFYPIPGPLEEVL